MENKEQGKSQQGHGNHMKMMALCCGLPILLVLSISFFGIQSESLDSLVFLLCPLLMGGMMFMNRKKGGSSCCDSDETKEVKQTEKVEVSKSNS